MTDPVVSRLHHCLVDAIRRRGEEPAARAFRVSEVYQDLVPYREVRSTLGVELNADYEHALLRLLSGEGGLLRLEPEEAREELRREVESAYPFVGMYRKFAINEVWISDVEEPAPAPVEVAEEPLQEAAPPVEPSYDERPAPPVPRDPPPQQAPPRQQAPPPPERRASMQSEHHAHQEPPPVRIGERRSPEERVISTPAECAFCDQALPVGRRVRFCPWCGSDQKLRPCPRCDEVLDRVWRFCINCGLEVPALASPRPPDPDE